MISWNNIQKEIPRLFLIMFLLVLSFPMFSIKTLAWDENDTPVYKGSIPNPPDDPYFEYIVANRGHFDSEGNLYVVDSSNNEIKQITAEGTRINMINSDTLSNVGINGVAGLDLINNSYFYIASRVDHKVSKISINGEAILSWGSSGSGDGQFNTPYDIELDTNSKVFVVDTFNHRIQVFDQNGGFLTKFGSSGPGNGQFSFPMAILIDENNFIYIADFSNSRIQKFEEKIGGICPSGGTEVGTSGYCYVTKWGSSGSGDGQFTTPWNIDEYGTGKVIVSDSSTRLQVFDTNGNFINKISYVDSVTNPTLLNVGQDGEIYIGSAIIGLRKITNSGETIWNFSSKINGVSEFNSPFGIHQNINGDIYVTDRWNCRIKVYDSEYNLKFSWGTCGTGDYQFNTPDHIDFDNNGNIYIVNEGGRNVKIYTKDGIFINKFGTSGSGDGQFNQPIGIKVVENGCLNDKGCIYVVEFGNRRVQVFNLENYTFNTRFGSSGSADGQFSKPYSIDIDSEGFIYVADSNNNRIQVFEKEVESVCPSGGFEVGTSGYCFVKKWGTLGNNNGQLSYPSDIKIVGNSIYVLELTGSRIDKFDLDGNFIWRFGSRGSGNGNFSDPRGLLITESGDILVTDNSNNRVQIYTFDKTSPEITITTDIANLPGNPPYEIKGTAVDDYTIIQFVQYQVDGTDGDWIDCTADDGVFDEKEEKFTCIVNTDIKDGSRQLYFRTSDSKTNEYITSEGYLMLPATGGEIKWLVWAGMIGMLFAFILIDKNRKNLEAENYEN